MKRYFLSPSSTTGRHTIYVIDHADSDSAAYLTNSLHCQPISRQAALVVDCGQRHSGRGSAWAQPEGRLRQADASGNPHRQRQLAATIDDAVEGTQKVIAFYRAMAAAEEGTPLPQPQNEQ